MFVGYLKKTFEDSLTSLQQDRELLDVELLKQTYCIYPQYCFAAYDKKEILGILSAYVFEKNIYVNILEVMQNNKDIILRLMTLFLRNTKDKNIFLLLPQNMTKYLDSLNFQEHSLFIKYVYNAEGVAFNFSNSIAKQVSGEDYDYVSKNMDSEVFDDNREEYISKDCLFSNSLKLSTNRGFLHSYVVNKRYIRISPWLMKEDSKIDAEKLLRGVLYYRGLKKIFAYVPKDVESIVELYESYKFKQEEVYSLLYLGQKPKIKLDSLYGL